MKKDGLKAGLFSRLRVPVYGCNKKLYYPSNYSLWDSGTEVPVRKHDNYDKVEVTRIQL
jgi:hypothetical protein